MQLDINGKRVALLGDPHLGRSFVHGVPLNRKGERENLVWQDFQTQLNIPAAIHVCMGDLFDRAILPYDVIVGAARRYEQAATQNPKTQYVILKGNHDWMRDLDRVSAFDVFHRMVAHIENIHVVTDQLHISELAFFAWHPVIKAVDNVETFGEGATVAFGHWDIESYGGNDDNLIPTAALAAAGMTKAYTGHIHQSQEFNRDGVDVVVTGSMQPYAHGEESDDQLYTTITKSELEDLDPLWLQSRCVRVVLQPGEILDQEINCLQLTIKKVTAEEDALPDVSLGDFDMESLFLQAFKDAGVSTGVTDRLLSQFANGRLAGDA